ncbi:MAG: Signal transduction histidine kinase, nitrogen specific, NtrB [Methanoculleus marisnigri]|uniref:Signal transduction histidine kinase, nitrogen specific, NtrB n=1 Tax=Methanoculleus marisnigri TaxID=2198 RepID=A0A101GPL9_9EURY|nr:MAG: Signal transduction histidine kinase, nitrogen specific, NtrB [Methanoculleus marisnigri]
MDLHTANRSAAGISPEQQGDVLENQGREDSVASETPAGTPGVTAAMLRQVIETSLSGICIIDQEGRIAFANASLLAMWGYNLHEVVGKPVTLLWPSRSEGQDCIGCALSSGRWNGTVAARRRDSSSFDVRVSISSVRDPETADPWLLLSCIEVAVQQKAEDAPGPRRSLEAAVAAMPARFTDPAEIDPAIDDSLEDLGRACGVCRAYLSLFNDSRTLLGTTHEWCRPDQKPVGFDRNTGDARFADEDVTLLSAAVHIIASALDRKQSEYLFRESEDLYQIVLDAITDTVTVVDTGLTLLLANDAFIAWCEDLGLATDVVGKDLFTVLPFLPPSARQLYERVARTGRPLTSERSLKFGDRVMILREMRIPIFEHGEVARIVTVGRDITAQREVEDLRSKAYAQIERNMEQFALLADHIRNPLQAIMGRAELLDDAGATEKIRQQVQRINGIIDQLDERWAESRKLSMFWRKYS